VYLDPPYWKQAEGQYSPDPTDLANMPLEAFTETLAELIKQYAEKLKRGRASAHIALLLQPTQWNAPDHRYTDHMLDAVGRVNLPLAMGLLGMRIGVGARWAGFDRAALAARLRAPLLVIHGAKDEICPVEDGQAIAEAMKVGDTLCLIAEGGHHSLWTDPKTEALCAASVEKFLKASAGNPRRN